MDRRILADALIRAAEVIREDSSFATEPQEDFFWSVLPTSLYELAADPELSLGSLDEAARQIEEFATTKRPASTNDLVWVADTLRAWAYSAAKQ